MSKEKITVTFNGTSYQVEAGLTILQAAKAVGIDIPTLCHFEGFPSHANCRVCVVEVEKMRTLQPACATKVADGMVIHTENERVCQSRKTTLQLLLSHHAVDCHHCLRIGASREQDLDPRFCEMCFWCDCPRDGFCELQTLARRYHIDVLPFIQHEADYREDESLHSIIRNPNKCIKCKRCVDVCGQVQTVHNLSMANRGREITVVPELGNLMADSACVRCGHCVDVCPVSAIYMKEHIDEIIFFNHQYNTKTLVQVSANVLPEIRRLYKVERDDDITMEHLCASFRKLMWNHVITDDYAQSLSHQKMAQAIEDGGKGVMVSNSRAVRNFVERYFPALVDQIQWAPSPQEILGTDIAARFAETDGVPRDDLKVTYVTNIKEFGAECEELHHVDFAINAREMYRMFLRTGGAPAMRYPCAFDFVGEPVTTPYDKLFENVWNMGQQPEEITLTVAGRELRCAIAHNLGQCRVLLEGNNVYDVMVLNA